MRTTIQTAVMRQALRDTRNAMTVIALLSFLLSGLSFVYILTYVMNPGAGTTLGPNPALDAYAYRQCLWFGPFMAVAFVVSGLVAWSASLKLVALGYRR